MSDLRSQLANLSAAEKVELLAVQVKQRDKAGRPDIDMFEAVMHCENREVGYFVSFGYTLDAENEARRFKKQTGKEIVLLTVQELLDGEITIHKMPPTSVKNSPPKKGMVKARLF